MTRTHAAQDSHDHHNSSDKSRRKSTVLPVAWNPEPEQPGSFEFLVLTEPGQVERWRKDKSIPLVDVVQSYSIFMAETGSSSGKLQSVPAHLLDEHFHTKDETVIIQQILQSGHVKKELHI